MSLESGPAANDMFLRILIQQQEKPRRKCKCGKRVRVKKNGDLYGHKCKDD